jgi:hypothetical protein
VPRLSSVFESRDVAVVPVPLRIVPPAIRSGQLRLCSTTLDFELDVYFAVDGALEMV